MADDGDPTRNPSTAAIMSTVGSYYAGRITEHGPTARGVDWNSTQSQERRFFELARVLRGEDDISLTDYGCGYGALVGYLNRLAATYTYCGYDVSPVMIDHARKLWAAQANCLFTVDPTTLTDRDYALASGVFNVKLEFEEADWILYVVDTLRKLSALSRRGFAFNMLTSYSDRDRMRSDLFYGDPCFFFDFCRTEFSRNVALLHDYDMYEFTVLVRK
jgi:hypothetical protein